MKRFNTIEGVFTPCLLSILGVIMYLRLGWVVGQVGLGTALLIIVIANLITLATALSMSSVVTNIRIGTGGAHSIIAKSLGVEVGGAIGIPLYLSQAVSVAFYVAGFTECWLSVFPQHETMIVSLTVWLGILLISYLSTKLAFRLQYIIMGIIGLSLVSIFLGKGPSIGTPLVGFKFSSFWEVFAIFFPAVTGILAGAAMSGELKDPKSSIPKGTLSAIGVSFVIYVGLALWLASHVSATELVANTSIVIDLGRWRWLVVAGIMGATLSSALSMIVGSPRTLMALGKHSILPFSSSFTQVNRRGEPAAAILFTALLVLLTLMLGTLDSVANLLTMFFLITYGMINLSVFIEQSIGITSFRPSFRIPRIVPFLGSVSCIVLMFLINTKFSLIAITLIVIIYVVLLRREVAVHSPDVRSGLLVFLAEQFARTAARLPYHPKIWKPNLMIPVREPESFKRVIPFIRTIVYPSGRAFFYKIIEPQTAARPQVREDARQKMLSLVQPLKKDELLVEASVAESPDALQGSITILQTVRDMLFPPNTLFYMLPDDEREDKQILQLIRKTEEEGLGIIILKLHEQLGFSQEKIVNLWIRRKSPNIDLSILVALQLRKNWEGHARLLQAVSQESEVAEAKAYLERLKKLMRLPVDMETVILVGDFQKVLSETPAADINIFGMPLNPNLQTAREVFAAVRTSVIFLRDSEHESAVA